MKKTANLIYPVLITALFVGFMALPQQAKADDTGAFEQLLQAADDGQSAASNPSDEGARETSGYGFDTPSETPPAVDLSESQTFTPSLLR